MRVAEAKAGAGGGGPRGYFEQSRDLLNSFFLVLPLLLVYQAGLIISGGALGNGADLTSYIVKAWGWNALIYFNLLLIVVGIAGVIHARKKKRFDPRIALPVAIESTVYGLVMGIGIAWVLSSIRPAFIPLAEGGQLPDSTMARVCLSLGAGVNEEFVFRLGMFAGGTAALTGPLKRNQAALIAALVSSVLFSLAHYLGSEAPQLYSFLFRFLAGMFFCGLFWVRGFAVAVYTHAIYDVLVMVVFAPK